MKQIPPSELNINPFNAIGRDWMLVTAGCAQQGYNTMTASWGHLGSIWAHGGGAPTAICYVRPQRYTKQFIDREPLYTLCFFPEEYKKQLGYLGSHSGRDEDKVANAGLTPAYGDGYTYFAEASLVLICRKVYQAPLKEEYFTDRAVLEEYYPQRDFHDLYIGQIEQILVSE